MNRGTALHNVLDSCLQLVLLFIVGSDEGAYLRLIHFSSLESNKEEEEEGLGCEVQGLWWM